MTVLEFVRLPSSVFRFPAMVAHEPEEEHDGGRGDPETRPVEDEGEVEAHGYGAAGAAGPAAARLNARAPEAGFASPGGGVPAGAVPPLMPIDQT